MTCERTEEIDLLIPEAYTMNNDLISRSALFRMCEAEEVEIGTNMIREKE